ncbi:hypothetical protein LJC31_00430 [Synergistaceae bacterium OttesenSCG-928-I11]|nr:hypothetical protein [Synergistaceae bacterium OttesenSCG-928-I11]
MPSFKQKRSFLVVLLLLISAVLMSGGCVGDSSVSGGGTNAKIVEAVPPSPDKVNLPSYATDLEKLKEVSVPVHISVTEPVDNVVCVMRLISGDVDYDPNTFKVSPVTTNTSLGRGAVGEEKEWMATCLIDKVTPGQSEYLATFDLQDAIDGDVSGQFAKGVEVSAVFYTVEVGALSADETDGNIIDVPDTTSPARNADSAEGTVSEYYYLGKMTTPDYDPKDVFKLEVKSIEFDPSVFLVESDDLNYSLTDGQNAAHGIFIGVPVKMQLALQNTALTSITISSTSAQENASFSDLNEHILVTTHLLGVADIFKSTDIKGGTSTLTITPQTTPVQPLSDDNDIDYGNAGVVTFEKQSLGGEEEPLAIEFMLAIKLVGKHPEDILHYLSDDKVNTPLTKPIKLNTPITITGEYRPQDAVTDASLADGVAHTVTVDTTISEDATLFTKDLQLLFEGIFVDLKHPGDIVAEEELDTLSRTAAPTSFFDYDSARIWDEIKSYTKYSGKEKFFRSGVDAYAMAYSRAFGVGFKVSGRVPMHILSKSMNLIHILGGGFIGDSGKTAKGYEPVKSRVGLRVYAFDKKLFDKEWDISKGVDKTIDKLSYTKEFSIKKSFHEYLVPVTLKGGVRGTLGVKPEIKYDGKKVQDLSIFIVPYLDTWAFAAAELDVYVFRAGIGGDLRMIKYEFKPGITFSLDYQNAQTVSGKKMALGIKPELKYVINHTLSTLDGKFKLYFDRRKYIVAGNWKNIKTYTIFSWGGWSDTWPQYNGTILSGKTIWYPEK